MTGAEQVSKFLETKRYAVVTGGNKGIGYEICKQLASKGVIVLLTARDEKRGLQAVDKLKEFGLSDHIVFHQLDVVDSASISSLAEFVKSQFGKLDILVNNAGVGGAKSDNEAMLKICSGGWPEGEEINWNEIITETYELADECLKTNYHGSKRMVEAFIPLLQLSDSARIVNIASSVGKLKNIPGERIKSAFRDIESLTEEKLDELVNEFLQDFKQGSLKEKGWPCNVAAYTVSKASMISWTRLLAKKYPKMYINSICPGFVKTDITCNTGIYTPEEGATWPVNLALMPNGSPTGVFYDREKIGSIDA